jgi:hypothetical protein
MSTTADLVFALKKELKSAQMTYADLAATRFYFTQMIEMEVF